MLMIDPHDTAWDTWLQKWFKLLLAAAVLVNAGGLLIDILEPDGALYATIAKTMANSGDFVNLRVEGKDWLDKPHFPFWMAALSFRVFGIHAFAYKLPALIFWGIGAWYTYRLAFSLYGRPVAQLSSLIYVSAAHLVISNNDVRAEPYLTGLVIGAIYHFYKASRLPSRSGAGIGRDSNAGKGAGAGNGASAGKAASAGTDDRGLRLDLAFHLVAGSMLTGCALMTKGPFILITIASGFILDWMMRKDWRSFRELRWWVALVLIILFTLPELYCLYIQFDLHPERIVFGRTGVSGIRFFFWDSQFGRFFNTGPIKGSGDPFFYFHTVLWAFLPWSLLLYAAIIQKCRVAFRRNAGHVSGRDAGLSGSDGPLHSIPGDLICLGGALTSFILFSLSRFQLPHYLNILFPFFSILTAGYLYGLRQRAGKIIRVVQGIINILLPALLLFLTWLFHFQQWPVLLGLLLFLSLLPFRVFRGKELPVYIACSFSIALLAYAFINFSLYPALLKYQAGTQAGRFVDAYGGAFGPGLRSWDHRNEPTRPMNDSICFMPEEGPINYSFEFSSPLPVQRIPLDRLPGMLKDGPILLFSPSSFADTLKTRGYTVDVLQKFPNFHVSQLTGSFLDHRTRETVLEWYSMMWISLPVRGPVFAAIP